MQTLAIIRMGPWVGLMRYGRTYGNRESHGKMRYHSVAFNTVTMERSMTQRERKGQSRLIWPRRTSVTHHEQLVYLIEQLQWLNGVVSAPMHREASRCEAS